MLYKVKGLDPDNYIIALYCYGQIHSEREWSQASIDGQRLYCHSINVFNKVAEAGGGHLCYNKEMNKTYLIPPIPFEKYFIPFNYNELWTEDD